MNVNDDYILITYVCKINLELQPRCMLCIVV